MQLAGQLRLDGSARMGREGGVQQGRHWSPETRRRRSENRRGEEQRQPHVYEDPRGGAHGTHEPARSRSRLFQSVVTGGMAGRREVLSDAAWHGGSWGELGELDRIGLSRGESRFQLYVVSSRHLYHLCLRRPLDNHLTSKTPFLICFDR
jgi:hypothetical protein